jgi:hypothetical protein
VNDKLPPGVLVAAVRKGEAVAQISQTFVGTRAEAAAAVQEHGGAFDRFANESRDGRELLVGTLNGGLKDKQRSRQSNN